MAEYQAGQEVEVFPSQVCDWALPGVYCCAVII